ncbi:DUF3108 domain-containing protein [Capnocytophaga sp. oral taxon 878]|uniref:DUF3108 domain-containing protein n=1 Tax=Capnocytophaga sp. oral taxon 878 TaxID=1316596 RepID=UPI000D042384|nr:DUF3108 domain-containing protein [Capnocytophaga sp. oral taxon 878]AVM50447.1 DUF3108 domain-containing protein [Capnocytophaga sp. oral taxon 878]
MKQLKKLLLLTLTTLFATPIIAQTTDDNLPFKNGEWLRFKVKYGIFNASTATMQLVEEMYNGEKVYHAIGKGSTTGLARVFFRVDDIYESYFGITDGKPRLFVRNIYEGGYTKHLKMYFNHSDNKVKIHNIENGAITEINFQPGLHDVISAFYALRHYPDIDNLKTGDQITLDMIFDDDEIYKFKLKLLGRESLKTNFGTVNTIKFCPLVQDGRVFKEEESITMWITDDKNKIPVKLRAALRVGSLVAELDGFNFLKHETKLKK